MIVAIVADEITQPVIDTAREAGAAWQQGRAHRCESLRGD